MWPLRIVLCIVACHHRPTRSPTANPRDWAQPHFNIPLLRPRPAFPPIVRILISEHAAPGAASADKAKLKLPLVQRHFPCPFTRPRPGRAAASGPKSQPPRSPSWPAIAPSHLCRRQAAFAGPARLSLSIRNDKSVLPQDRQRVKTPRPGEQPLLDGSWVPPSLCNIMSIRQDVNFFLDA